MGEIRKLIATFIDRFILLFVLAIPIFILGDSILPRYLRYIDPKPVEDAVFEAVIVALLMAIIPPVKLGEAVVKGFNKLVKALIEFVKKW